MPPTCSFCQSPTLQHFCTCGQVSYCGRDCQKSDWKRHKQDCPPFTVKEVPGKGRGLVATRNLGLGCTILTELPVLVVAFKRTNYDKLLSDFRSKSQEIQAEILNLYDPLHPYTCPLGKEEDLSDDKKLIAKLDRIVEINSISGRQFGKEPTKNLYLKAALLNHDCRPNLTWYPKLSVPGMIVVNVLRKIVKGEELTVSYIKDENCLTRIQRKEKLVPYMFDCQCDICKEEDTSDEELRKKFQNLRGVFKTSVPLKYVVV